MKKIHDTVPARFKTKEQAAAFIEAYEKNSFESPYVHGAIFPYVTHDGVTGINPEYHTAQFELEIWQCLKVNEL